MTAGTIDIEPVEAWCGCGDPFCTGCLEGLNTTMDACLAWLAPPPALAGTVPPRTGPSDRVPLVGIVACCRAKQTRPAPACDLYTSPLFRYSRAYVERACDAWVILSALHRVVCPDTLLYPYDVTLARLPQSARRVWTTECRCRVTQMYPDARFLVLAGAEYRTVFADLPHDVPMQGLGIGQQLAWLKERVELPKGQRGQ